MERRVEMEVWNQRGAPHFEVRMSYIGCQYTHKHTHKQSNRERGTIATEDDYGHKEKEE